MTFPSYWECHHPKIYHPQMDEFGTSNKWQYFYMAIKTMSLFVCLPGRVIMYHLFPQWYIPLISHKKIPLNHYKIPIFPQCFPRFLVPFRHAHMTRWITCTPGGSFTATSRRTTSSFPTTGLRQNKGSLFLVDYLLISDLMAFYSDLMGFYGDLMDSDSMGFYSDSMGY